MMRSCSPSINGSSAQPHCSFNVDHRLAKPFSTGPAATPYRRTAPGSQTGTTPPGVRACLLPLQGCPPIGSGSGQYRPTLCCRLWLNGTSSSRGACPRPRPVASSGKNGSTAARSCPPDDRPSAPRRSRCPPFRLTMSVWLGCRRQPGPQPV